MLSIFVCEDNKVQRDELVSIIDKYLLISDLDMKIVLATGDPDELINYIDRISSVGLYFLDVDLKSEKNGIQLAVEIRKRDPRGFIVFVTSHAELSYMTFMYKVEAMDYIIKDNYGKVRERVEECIIDANTKYSAKTTELKKNFTLKTEDKIINIRYDKIIFFETSSIIHKVILHAVDRRIEFYAKMKEVEVNLDERFYRCHKSYIINKEHIKEIDIINRSVLMVNGDKCLVSSRLLKGII